MYLHVENTQQMIANKLGVDQKTVFNVLEKFSENGNFSEFTKNTEPSLGLTPNIGLKLNRRFTNGSFSKMV